jgi:hypothetical protein
MRAGVKNSELPVDGWQRCYMRKVDAPAEIRSLERDITNSTRRMVQWLEEALRCARPRVRA